MAKISFQQAQDATGPISSLVKPVLLTMLAMTLLIAFFLYSPSSVAAGSFQIRNTQLKLVSNGAATDIGTQHQPGTQSLNNLPTTTTQQRQPLTNTIDFVLAYYNEGEDMLRNSIARFTSLSKFKNLQKRVFVYIKDETKPDLSPLFKTFLDNNNIPIISDYLPNIGREGHTFLHHMSTHHGDFADHVLFAQASESPEAYDLMSLRIEKLFEPQFTGMMALQGVDLCNCRRGGCGVGFILLSLRDLYNHLSGKLCKDEVFSFFYRGTFIVSRHRLMQRAQPLYKQMLEMFDPSDSNPVLQDKQYLTEQVAPDMVPPHDPKNPLFGYVLERSWTLLFTCYEPDVVNHCHCWTEKGADHSCPRSDCQCADLPDGTIKHGYVAF